MTPLTFKYCSIQTFAWPIKIIESIVRSSISVLSILNHFHGLNSSSGCIVYRLGKQEKIYFFDKFQPDVY